MKSSVGESPVDDGSQFRIVDELLAPIRSQGDRGLEQRLPGNDEVTARKLLAHSPQIDAGKNDLRPRRADIDSDTEQRDMILDPQGVVLETAVRLVVVVVVVNLLVSVMAMIVITAVKMVLQLVRPLRVRVVRHVASYLCIRVRRVHELLRPFIVIFRAFIAIVHQFESENAVSRVDVNPGRICKQTSALRADTPIDHVANDLRSAFDAARRHHGAVGERDLVMKLEELPSRLGIQGDHGSLSVLIPDEHDSIADAQCPEGLPIAQSALDSIVRRSLPQDLPRTGIHGMNHAVDGLESSTIVEDGDSIGAHIGWRIY